MPDPIPTSPARTTDWPGALLVVGAVVAIAALLLWHDPSFFLRDDFQEGGLPEILCLADALRHGIWPLLTDHSWVNGAPGACYQSGLFSLFAPLAMLAAACGPTLPSCGAIFALCHLIVLALGVFVLARGRSYSRPLSLFASLTTTWSGFVIAWGAGNWLPVLTSFAWLPWYWWALERATGETRRPLHAVLAGLFLYLLISSGWPWTDVMALLICAMVGARVLLSGQFGRLLPLVASGLIGLGLSAPALLLFLDFMRHTTRAGAPALHLDPQWVVPLQSLLAAVCPSFVTNWNEFGALRPHLSLELTEGLVPVCCLCAALIGAAPGRFLRRNRWDFALFVLALAAALLPGFGEFRWSFRWLPLAQLTLALLATDWLAQNDEATGLARPSVWALGFGVLNLAFAYWQPALPLAFAWLYLGIALVWWLLERRGQAFGGWTAVGVAMAALAATYWYVPISLPVTTWHFSDRLRSPAPLDPHALYFRVAQAQDWFGPLKNVPDYNQLLRIGDSYDYAGLHFVNGYNTTELAGMWAQFPQPTPHGFFLHATAVGLLSFETPPGRLFARMGVDDLIVAASLRDQVPALLARGWKVVTQGPDATVLHRLGPASPRVYGASRVRISASDNDAIAFLSRHRRGPIPLVVSAMPGERPGERDFGPLTLTPLQATPMRLRYQVSVGTHAPAMALFARPWVPGMRAWLDGREVPVRRYELMMMAVELPAGAHGTLTLAYRPKALERGLAVAAATLLLTLLGWWWARRRAKAAACIAEAPAAPRAAAG